MAEKNLFELNDNSSYTTSSYAEFSAVILSTFPLSLFICLRSPRTPTKSWELFVDAGNFLFDAGQIFVRENRKKFRSAWNRLLSVKLFECVISSKWHSSPYAMEESDDTELVEKLYTHKPFYTHHVVFPFITTSWRSDDRANFECTIPSSLVRSAAACRNVWVVFLRADGPRNDCTDRWSHRIGCLNAFCSHGCCSLSGHASRL